MHAASDSLLALAAKNIAIVETARNDEDAMRGKAAAQRQLAAELQSSIAALEAEAEKCMQARERAHWERDSKVLPFLEHIFLHLSGSGARSDCRKGPF